VERFPEPLASRTAVALIFCGAWAVLLVAGRSRLLRDPGTFWHILTGERIFTDGFPRADWLSFTFGGRPWVAHQWLGECAMATLHRLGGLDALVVATSGALALLLAWLFSRLVNAGVTRFAALLVVALVFLASSLHFHVRPHIISIWLFAWTYSRLTDVEAGRRTLRSMWALPFVFLVWVNAHGAAVGGFATLGIFVAGWTVAWAARKPSPIRSMRESAAVWALVAACAATIPLTPYGLDTARAWFAILASPELPQRIIEHASLVRTGSWEVLVLGAVYLVAVAGAPRTALRVSSVLPLVWLVLTFERVRHAPLFAAAAALALGDLLPRVRWAAWLQEKGIRLRGPQEVVSGPRVAAASAAAVVLALVAVAVHHHSRPAGAPATAVLDPAQWPVELVPGLRAVEHEVPPGEPVLNDMSLGGFIAYHAPGLRLFVDDRWELYGDDFMVAQIDPDPRWLDGWVARSGVTVAVAAAGSPLQRYLDETDGWQCVASARAGSLYRRAPGVIDSVVRRPVAPATGNR
jgi:hypothetical protein